MKLTAVNFAKFSPGRLDDYPGSRQSLEGFIGNQHGIGTAHGNIADMGGSTTQVANFARKGGPVVLVEPRVCEQEAFIIDVSRKLAQGPCGVNVGAAWRALVHRG